MHTLGVSGPYSGQTIVFSGVDLSEAVRLKKQVVDLGGNVAFTVHDNVCSMCHFTWWASLMLLRG